MRLVTLLLPLALACNAGKTRYVSAKPEPCLVPEKPMPPDIEASICEAGGERYICLSAQEAAELAAWIEAMVKWVEIASECPGVGELGAGNAA